MSIRYSPRSTLMKYGPCATFPVCTLRTGVGETDERLVTRDYFTTYKLGAESPRTFHARSWTDRGRSRFGLPPRGSVVRRSRSSRAYEQCWCILRVCIVDLGILRLLLQTFKISLRLLKLVRCVCSCFECFCQVSFRFVHDLLLALDFALEVG